MANEKLIRKIQKGFGAVYEMGDDALDAVAEARDAGARELFVGDDVEAEVRAALGADLLDVVLGRDAGHQLLGILRRAGWALHALQHAVRADAGWNSHADVQIGGALGHHQLQQVGHRVSSHSLCVRPVR